MVQRYGSGNTFYNGDGNIKQIQNLHTTDNKNALTREVVNILGAFCADSIGFKDGEFDILNCQLFATPPNSTKIDFTHQDNAYFKVEESEEIYTFWIPLHDVGFKNSCMVYYPYSHEDGLLEHEPLGKKIRTRTGVTGKSLYITDELSYKPKIMKMKYGEYLVHDKNTIHKTTQNQTDTYRTAITFIIKKKK